MDSILIIKPDSLKLKEPIVSCGMYAPQKHEFPLIGGSGPGRMIKPNDAFILSGNIIIENKKIPSGTVFVSLVNNPTQDINHWLLLECEPSVFKWQALDNYITPSVFIRFKKLVLKTLKLNIN